MIALSFPLRQIPDCVFPPVQKVGSMSIQCPCGSGKEFSACCEPYVKGIEAAPTAEALMRSRYSAYVKEEIQYLKDTLTKAQQSDFSNEDTRKWAKESKWLGLEIQKTEEGGPDDSRGLVEFEAHFETNGEKQTHHETAVFEKEGKNWLYSGTIAPQGETVRRTEPKIGRNEPCPCGSGKKYKRCCGA